MNATDGFDFWNTSVAQDKVPSVLMTQADFLGIHDVTTEHDLLVVKDEVMCVLIVNKNIVKIL